MREGGGRLVGMLSGRSSTAPQHLEEEEEGPAGAKGLDDLLADEHRIVVHERSSLMSAQI